MNIKLSGLQIIFLSWKDIYPTKSLFWSDKTEMWSFIYLLFGEKRFGHGPILLSRILSDFRQLFAAAISGMLALRFELTYDNNKQLWDPPVT